MTTEGIRRSGYMDGMERRAERRGRYLLLMSFGALGVVYGDIGTSPLYAFREAFAAADGLAVDRQSIFGILSLMTWSLVVIVSVKYLSVVMRADNDGEGGILALTALVTSDGTGPRTVRRLALAVGLFGTALLYGDGIITPAISVLSAVEGLEVAAPDVGHWAVPLAVVILVGLFAIQPRGTSAIGSIFGPVMAVWFVVLAVLGIHEISLEPAVLAAVNPLHAVRFVVAEPGLAFLALGAIFLVVTGSEALYADMGHFGAGPIRLGWFTIVFPSLLLNYFGQGALLLREPGAIDNPFFRMPPSWATLPMVVLATMATVIASQALISGAYSLTTQAMQLDYLPRMTIDHTSPREVGQVYIGAINWTLMIACIILVVTFRESTRLAAAYGVAVTTTMVITTVLLFGVMRRRWGWSLPVAGAVCGIFLVIDAAFLAANIVKVPAGGWVPLAVGAIVFSVMITWKRGRRHVIVHRPGGDLPIERFIGSLVEHDPDRVTGTAVYMTPDTDGTPPALLTNLRLNEVVHETIVLTTVRTRPVPRVPRARRATVHDLGHGFFQVVLQFGFFEQPDVPVALADIVHRQFGFDPSDATFVLGRESVVPTERSLASWREHLYAFMHRNSASAARYYQLPPRAVVEVGAPIELGNGDT
jgi:KUP system potassium uptake protein